jgi:drug/metabolite transporter (DMT)-like permease
MIDFWLGWFLSGALGGILSDLIFNKEVKLGTILCSALIGYFMILGLAFLGLLEIREKIFGIVLYKRRK